jgi:transcriptional antiterminator
MYAYRSACKCSYTIKMTYTNLYFKSVSYIVLCFRYCKAYEIANTLQISRPTITRDIQYLNQNAKNSIRKYVDERLPEEYENCLVGITAILRQEWTTADRTQDNNEKIQAISIEKLIPTFAQTMTSFSLLA